MKKLIYVLIVLIMIAGIWYLSLDQKGSSEQTTITQTSKLNADVYPLYTGAIWGDVQATSSPDFGSVMMVQSALFTDVTNIAKLSTPFTQYYHDKLIASGWIQDIKREAGGPGSEISVYTNGDRFIVVSFHSVFTVHHPDAPSECPCNVRFTLMTRI